MGYHQQEDWCDSSHFFCLYSSHCGKCWLATCCLQFLSFLLEWEISHDFKNLLFLVGLSFQSDYRMAFLFAQVWQGMFTSVIMIFMSQRILGEVESSMTTTEMYGVNRKNIHCDIITFLWVFMSQMFANNYLFPPRFLLKKLLNPVALTLYVWLRRNSRAV